MNETTYPIHERFHAFQGEGVHAGRSAFFIRTFGCPVHCPWCDSAGTWHKDYVPKKVIRLTVDELVNEALESGCEFVVITGGEPTVHDLGPLCFALRMANLDVHLETCGAYVFDRTGFDWVTVSPKWDKLPLSTNLRSANEIKVIVEVEESINQWTQTICDITGSADIEGALIGALTPAGVTPVWLHPEWSKRDAPAILQKIAKHIKAHGDPFRAGWQLHKLYSVDGLDGRSQRLSPLGGNPDLGY